jgi:hypothetical protein
MTKVKFIHFSRVICPRTGIHYLDAIDEDNRLWSAQQRIHEERWLTFIPGESWRIVSSLPNKQ